MATRRQECTVRSCRHGLRPSPLLHRPGGKADTVPAARTPAGASGCAQRCARTVQTPGAASPWTEGLELWLAQAALTLRRQVGRAGPSPSPARAMAPPPEGAPLPGPPWGGAVPWPWAQRCALACCRRLLPHCRQTGTCRGRGAQGGGQAQAAARSPAGEEGRVPGPPAARPPR